jgi:hypothetical protein
MKASVKQKGTRKMVTEKGSADGAKAKPEAKPKVLKVKAGAKYRGARDAWYVRLKEHDGKSVEEFLESCKKKPPSVPKSGTAENPTGWLRFFERSGNVSQIAA